MSGYKTTVTLPPIVPIISEDDGRAAMREFHKDIKVRYYKEYDGWNYEVTGFQPPHERTVHITGPFKYKFQARRDFHKEFIALYK